MKQNEDPCLRMITRAYSYLRLAGASETTACRRMQILLGEMAAATEGQALDEARWAELWNRFMTAAATDESLCEQPPLEPLTPPDIERGHIGYAY